MHYPADPPRLSRLSLSAPQLTYKSDSNQLGFLQLLSTNAQQNLTYHCKNSVAYHDVAKNTYRKAIKFLAYNDAEITARGNARFRYEVLEDGCKVGCWFKYSRRVTTSFSTFFKSIVLFFYSYMFFIFFFYIFLSDL